MPEIPAMEPVDVAPLPAIIPSVARYRGWRSRISESSCAMTIWILAESLLEWESYSFIWQHNTSAEANFLQFFFEKSLDGFDYVKGKFNELHLFEDLYYVALAKIIELHNDLRLRFSNGFLHSTTVLYTKTKVNGIIEATTAHDMQQHLEFVWHELTSVDMLSALHNAIQTEHIVRLKASHNMRVFRTHQRLSSSPTTPTESRNATFYRVRDTLRAHFDPREIKPGTPGLADVSRLGAAGLMALVWSRSSFGLQSWAKQVRQPGAQPRKHLDRISTATMAVPVPMDWSPVSPAGGSSSHSPYAPSSPLAPSPLMDWSPLSSGSDNYSPASPLASSPSGCSTAPTTPDRDSQASADGEPAQPRLRHSRKELHRQRALLKLTGVLPPNQSIKPVNTAPAFLSYRSVTPIENNLYCICKAGCSCSYWCTKEPWQPCACRYTVAHIPRTRRVSVAGSEYTETSQVVSEPETVTEEMVEAWMRLR